MSIYAAIALLYTNLRIDWVNMLFQVSALFAAKIPLQQVFP